MDINRCNRLSFLFLLFGISILPASAQNTIQQEAANKLVDYFSSFGSIAILPWNNWASGDWDALTDEFFGYDTPRVNKFKISMEQTLSSIYEGGLFFKKLNLGLGATLKTDNNIIGHINHFMGFLNIDVFEARIEYSSLKGTAEWLGETIVGLPDSVDFDNQLLNVDLLYSSPKGLYFGIGYSSYALPVQINCLVWDDSLDSVWWAPVVSFYQPDMKFSIYSFLFGFDTLHDALFQKGIFGSFQGFSFWAWTQDRFGVGTSEISDQVKAIVEAANGNRTLWSATQIAMMVDYNLTLGIQFVQHIKRFHVGIGIGYNIGGQTLTCITPKGPVESGYVDASPSVYLVHYGPMIKGSIRF
ncbi:MAG: hypothetical protein LDL24_03620 [Treponema sp.]|nr:hypothetical protein [Treponema sp.]